MSFLAPRCCHRSSLCLRPPSPDGPRRRLYASYTCTCSCTYTYSYSYTGCSLRAFRAPKRALRLRALPRMPWMLWLVGRLAGWLAPQAQRPDKHGPSDSSPGCRENGRRSVDSSARDGVKLKPLKSSSESLRDFPSHGFSGIFSSRKNSERESRCAHWKLGALTAPPGREAN